VPSFKELYAAHLRAPGIASFTRSSGECQTPDRRLCTVCHASRLAYDEEMRIKNLALQEFWRQSGRDATLQPLIASPMGRRYRTVSKRKAFQGRGGPVFGLIDMRQDKARPLPVVSCLIEPADHASIYHACGELLLHPSMRVLADRIRYIVIKGNYHEQTVILNVNDLDGKARHAANAWSKRLTKRVPSITGVFLFEDAGSDRYYLGSGSPDRAPALTRVFGKPSVFLKIQGKSVLFHPLSFSQVNASMIDTLVNAVRDQLPGNDHGTLYDLYSGYGLFSLSLAPQWKRVVGMELSHDAVHSARENAGRRHIGNVNFLRNAVTAETVLRAMAGSAEHDSVILDPPRNGTDPGVIEAVASRAPERIVHLFCNIDLAPDALDRWRDAGYRIAYAAPIDNFPGTDEVELLVTLQRS
jgi:tRNA/tmRNA/rRNA uracil-C5-methylase (TrmA/RlmC/RlmD family)